MIGDWLRRVMAYGSKYMTSMVAVNTFVSIAAVWSATEISVA